MNHRRHGPLEFPRDQLQSLLRLAFPQATMDAAQVMMTGAVNTVYRLTFDKFERHVALRIYQRDGDACQREVNLMQALGSRVPMPKVRYAEFAPQTLSQPFLISDWCDGITLQDALMAEPSKHFEYGSRIGEALAAIGSLSFETSGRLNADLSVTSWAAVFGIDGYGSDHVAGIVQLLQTYLNRHAGKHLGTRDTERLVQTTIRLGKFLPEDSAPPRLVHGDFNPSNIIVTGNSKIGISGIIDWEWAHAGNPYFDIANLFRERGFITDEFTAGFRHEFQRAGGTLDDEWRTRALLSDLISLLEMIDVDGALNEHGAHALGTLKNSLDKLEGIGA